MIIEHTVGLHDQYIARQPLYTNLFAVVAIALYTFSIREKKQIYFNGDMNWQQGFLSGVVLSIVICVLSPIVQYVSYAWISPDFFDNIIKYSVQKKVFTEAKAESYFTLSSYIKQGIYNSLSMGVIISATVAQFLKTKKSE